MSIRTNPTKAVPLLLRRLATNKSLSAEMDELKPELNNIKGILSSMKKYEEELIDLLARLDVLLRESRKEQDQEKSAAILEKIQGRIKDLTQKLQPFCDTSQTSKDEDKIERVHPPLSLNKYNINELVEGVLKWIQVSYDNLNLRSKLCLLSLSIFPENAVMKKRHTIYWWIGEGFVKKTGEKSAEEVGEDVVDELLSYHLIVTHGSRKCPIVNKFKMNPWIRNMLVFSVLREDQLFGFYSQVRASSHSSKQKHACLVLDEEKVKMSDDIDLGSKNWRTVFNVGTSNLNFGHKWMDKQKKLVVLQLGRWDSSPHHIQVNGKFLKDLKAQKHLKYLSLRGISRISQLPSSIVELVSLEILDLKACYDLEELPNNIASLKRLTHLDASRCYLLASMPKVIEKLIELQVLKGFVIGSSSKTPCRITDLAKLTKLTRLSIHIGSEAVIQENEFESLKELLAVKRLKISWGTVSKYKEIQVTFPPNLDKLDLEGFPGDKIPWWLKPSNLPRGLKKLYIKGGLLKSMDHGEIVRQCFVEIVRLRYLNHLETNPNLLKLFPSLRYAEKKQVLGYSYSEWSIEDKDESTSMSQQK